MPAPIEPVRLRRLAWLATAALLLLAAGGVRHHLVWGESERWPWLLPLLNAFEAGSVAGFTVLGGLAGWRGVRIAATERLGAGGRGLGTAAADRRAGRRVVGVGLPILAAAILVPPFLSMDPIDYVVRGRVVTLHGGNPYVDVPSTFADDPFLGYGDAPWKDFPLPYGPVVADLQGLVAWFANRFAFLPEPGELVVAIALFKLVFAGSLLGAAVVARAIVRRLAPGSESRAFVAVLWNPLLLNECVAQCHNEALLLLTVLGAVGALLAHRAGTAALVLGVGVLVKFVPLLLGPHLLAVAVRQRRLGAFALGVGGAAALAAMYWWQYFRVDGAFDFLSRQSAQNASSVLWGLQQLLGVEARTVLLPGRVLVVVAALVAVWQVWRRPEPRVLLTAVAATMLTLVACGLTLHGPWYHVWWLPFALLLGSGYLFRAACIASVSAPLGYLVWAFARRHDEPSQWLTLALGMLVPLLGALLWRPRAANSETPNG